MDEFFFDILLLSDSSIRLVGPLILAALAGMFAERSGIVDISLEGKMLGAAFAAAATAAVTGSPWLGLLAGIGTSILLALLHGFVSITHRGEQIVSGMAINILVAGLAPVLANSWFHLNGQTPLLDGDQRFLAITLPGTELLSNIPLIGTIYVEVISGQNILTYAALILVPVSAWVLYKTRFGLRLRAAGENPEAVDTAGISVIWLRYQAMIVAGVLCGVAGTSLSTALGAGFLRDMTAGKGFLALAAMIFGRWKPVPTLLACLLFAFSDALQGRLQGVDLPVVGIVSVQFIMMLPYVVTVIALAGFVGHIRPPAASGKPFVRSR